MIEVTETVAEARALAAKAAAHAGVRIGSVHDRAHLERLSSLFDEVWGRDRDAGSIVAPELLRALEHAGCQVTAAFDVTAADEPLVGGTAALVGLHDTSTILHSHVTGTLDAVRGRGVGWALKLHQRAWCLERGIGEVRWTYDPLIRRNAVINLVKLGARPVAYLDDLYGPMRDTLNAGMPTDRLVVSWSLDEPRVVAAVSGRPSEPRLGGLRRAGAVELLRDRDGEPDVVGDVAGQRLLVQVPQDIERLRSERPDAAARWADAIRGTLGSAMRAGHRVTGATRDGWYVLVRDERVEELT